MKTKLHLNFIVATLSLFTLSQNLLASEADWDKIRNAMPKAFVDGNPNITSMHDDAEFKELDSIIPSPGSALGAQLAYTASGIDGKTATAMVFANFKQHVNPEFVARVEALSDRIKTSRTAYMLTYTFIAADRQVDSNQMETVARALEFAESENREIANQQTVENLLETLDQATVYHWVEEMRYQLPECYLKSNWPKVHAMKKAEQDNQ